MEIGQYTPGNIFKANFTDDLLRLLAIDDYQVFYEYFDSSKNIWGYGRVKNLVFPRMSVDYFVNNTILVEEVELDIADKEFFYLELSQRITMKVDSIDDLDISFYDKIEKVTPFYLLQVSKLKTFIKPILIESNEDIDKVKEIIHEFFTNNKSKIAGIGIHRSGLKKGLPSFYLWDYYDLAGCVKKKEEL